MLNAADYKSCSKCSTANCFKCKDGDASKCSICARGYFSDQNFFCQPCSSECLQCMNLATCTVCSFEYSLINGTCYRCPPYQEFDTGENKCKIQSIENCYQSSGGQCELCKTGYNLNTTTHECNPCQYEYCTYCE